MNGDPPPPTPPTEGVDPLALEASAPSGSSGAPLPLASSEPVALVPSVASIPSDVADAPERFGSVPAPASMRPSQAPQARPTFLFLGVVAAIVLIPDHLSFTLARNRGGAWGLLENASEMIRRPFFLLVSGLAIAFIVSLYGRLGASQRALKWGLPLVLGGALGNLSDRIIRSSVIDFIDYRANWIESMNRGIFKVVHNWGVTDHWPTFNVADVSICVGVGLMALDMFTSKRGHSAPVILSPEPALSTGPTSKPPTP